MKKICRNLKLNLKLNQKLSLQPPMRALRLDHASPMKLYRVPTVRSHSFTLLRTRSTLLRKDTPINLCAASHAVLPRRLRGEREIVACVVSGRMASVPMEAPVDSSTAMAEAVEEVIEEEAVMVEVVAMTETEEVGAMLMDTTVEGIALALVTEMTEEEVEEVTTVVEEVASVIAAVTAAVIVPVIRESASPSRKELVTEATAVALSMSSSRLLPGLVSARRLTDLYLFYIIDLASAFRCALKGSRTRPRKGGRDCTY